MTGGSHRAGYVSLWGSVPIESISICQLLPAGGVTISEQLNKHNPRQTHQTRLQGVEAAPMAFSPRDDTFDILGQPN